MVHPARILEDLGIHPSKSLGQNFLADENIARKIVAHSVTRGAHVVEVGPGLGALTRLILDKAASLHAIEIDGRLARYLENELKGSGLIVLEQDFLDLREGLIEKWVDEGGTSLTLVGNLPYSASGHLVMKFVSFRNHLASCGVMLQKEVARRLASSPGSREYGSLSVILQSVAGVKILFPVSRNSFYPAPEVDSAFIKIDFTPHLPWVIDDFELFKGLVNRAFQMRRKVIRNALKGHFLERGGEKRLISLLESSGISPRSRPEEIPVDRYVALANKDSGKA